MDTTPALTRQLALAETALTRALREERRPAPRKLVPRALPVLSITRNVIEDEYGEEDYGSSPPRYSESELFAHETRALPDIVSVNEREPRPGGFTVTERLESNRRERHDVAVSEMHQELEVLKLQIEAQIHTTTRVAKENLQSDGEAIIELFEPFEDDADCVAMTLPQLDEAGATIAARSQPRQEMIAELIGGLKRIETERAERAAKSSKRMASCCPPLRSSSTPRCSASCSRRLRSSTPRYSAISARWPI
jgi:hypothetical protein